MLRDEAMNFEANFEQIKMQTKLCFWDSIDRIKFFNEIKRKES